MNNKPKISLITPNFNCGDHLEETIKSVLSQNYSNLQFIVIDGGSTDNSIEIIKKYEKHIDYWVSEPDSGAADAILKGFDKADGEWMNWLNSDDYLLPDALNMLADVISASPTSKWITGTRIFVNKSGGGLRHSGGWYLHNIEHLLRDTRYAQECTFFKKSFYDSVGGIDKRLRSIFDRELYLRMVNIDFPTFTTAVFGVIRNRPGQLSKNENERKKDYPYLVKYYNSRSLPLKILGRLINTRLNRFLKITVDFLFKFKLLKLSKSLKVVFFDEVKNKWIEVPYGEFNPW